MKKVLSIVSACLVLACVMVMAVAPVSAATPKEDIVAAAKSHVPAKYHADFLPALENILAQVDVDATQAAAVIAHIEAAKAAVSGDKGPSLSEYTRAEQAAVVAEAKAACAVLGLDCEFKPSEDPDHVGDVVLEVTQNGQKIGDVDHDIKKTNTAVDYTVIIAGAALAVVAAVAAVYGKKLVASR